MKHWKIIISLTFLFGSIILLVINSHEYNLYGQKSAVIVPLEDTVNLSKDTVSSVKEKNPLTLFSNTGENITSQIKKVILDGKEISTDNISKKLDNKAIKSIGTGQKGDSIWLYIDTK